MNLWLKFFMSLHVFVYRLTGGVLGGRMAGQSVLLLSTVGRKSGKRRITPINYFHDRDRFVVVASNWGRTENPAWYVNLRNQTAAAVQVGGVKVGVRPEEAEGGEYARLWKLVSERNDFYERYQQHTRRRIPIVVLIPDRGDR